MLWAQAVLSTRLWASPAQAPVPDEWLPGSSPGLLLQGQWSHAPGSPRPSTNPNPLGGAAPGQELCPLPAWCAHPGTSLRLLSVRHPTKRMGDGQLLTREAAPTPSPDQFKFLV